MSNAGHGADLQVGDAKEVGERIQRLRNARKLTQRQLAEPKYTAAYVSTLEAGKARASETALRYFAEKLDTTYEQLASGVPATLRTELREGLAEAGRLMDAGEETGPLLTALIARARRHGVADLESELRVALGNGLVRRGALAEAQEEFERAQRLLADAPLPERVRAVRGLATVHQLRGDVRYACYLLEKTIDELNAEGLPDPAALLLLYATVITPYMDLGAYERAAKAASLALGLAPSVPDPVAVAGLHRSVARTLAARGRYAEAETHLVKAEELYQRREIRTELAQCHWMRGYLHTQHGRLAEAEDELRTAREMLRAVGAEFYAVQVEVELADVRRRRGRPAEAEEVLRGLLAGLGPGNGAVHAAAAHRLLGLIHEERGEDAAAEAHYRAAIPLQEEAEVTGDLADTARLLGDLLHRHGRTEEAVVVYRRGLTRLARPGTTTLGPPLPDRA
ncbi:helix-turn-helix domain-containing protein [Streptantibioticus cattleyicolor]|uniref:Tetratricopeptide TPR_2 repeat protein n=1 Tax=Streptantibioticus cattleyicolor (strain ATCC 35852 / DSM 46488 / JCM 4925 / NBRC 14057 / NRRL 8057) TaxID=1003195 RepID=F8JMB0_STREN|nr:tetratricopeptide repeat protein [Streptantibioticus cattleyicolor]AEW99341.1 Tetratricopeptide TPR_2 repeat protein [Streptantibioticus cattleyicolor NRRL 8057 = DSM 46488]CCB71618.1 Tetratricopeptide repeat protein [Streptantibioticus cattleyicolor NRRL 8057 = DSM 46488]